MKLQVCFAAGQGQPTSARDQILQKQSDMLNKLNLIQSALMYVQTVQHSSLLTQVFVNVS